MTFRFSIILILVSLAGGVLSQTPETAPEGVRKVPQPTAAEIAAEFDSAFSKWTLIEEENFTIRFPGPKPTKSTAPVDFGFGPKDQISYESQTPYGIFSVKYMDMPGEIADAAALKRIYDLLEANSAERGNAISDSKDIMIGNYAGRDYVVKPKTSGTISTTIAMRAVMFGKRMFQLSVIRAVVAARDTEDRRAMALKYRKEFFDSLTPVADAKSVTKK